MSGRLLRSGRTLIMGVVNRTPDSFFDGGSWLDDEVARQRVVELVRAGADIVDVGAESTRPGSDAISAREQIERLGEIIPFTVSQGVVASIDTTLPEVAEHALRQGALVVNSVSLEPAAELAEISAGYGAALVLTHCRGSMSDMAGFSTMPAGAYADVVAEVESEWRQAARRALARGLAVEDVWFDPGLGFAKQARDSLALCRRLAELKSKLGHPVLVGPSRKSYLAATVAEELGTDPPLPRDRLGASIAAVLHCAEQGADVVRVHDVAEASQALAYWRAARSSSTAPVGDAGAGGAGA